MKKYIYVLLIIIGVMVMLKPINSIIKDSIRNIVFRGNVVTGIVAIDNGDGSYDVFISESDRAYPKIFTLSANPNLAVGDKVRILYMNGCKELPIILPPVTIAITGEWVSPTGHLDPDHGSRGWWVEERAYDEDTALSANFNVNNASWSNFLQLTHAAMRCNKVRFWAANLTGKVDTIDVDAYYEGTWHHVYEGSDYEDRNWTEKSLTDIKIITKFRFRLYNSDPISDWAGMLYEVDFFKVDE